MKISFGDTKMKDKLKFNKRLHKYSINGRELESVTTFIKKFFNPFDLKIAKYVAKGRRNKGELNAKGKPITAWDVRREWKNTAKEGTHVHEQIEEFIKTRGYGMEVSEVHEKAKQGIIYYVEEMRSLDHSIPTTEFKIYSEKLGLAGTIDLGVAHLDGDENLVVNLYDWKTNKQLRTKGFKKSPHPLMSKEQDCNFTHYTLQLSLYAYILETEYEMEIGDLVIVHLTDSTATPYKVRYERDLIEEMLNYKEE